MNKITIAEYLLRRLEELGIKHLFGLPGDYNLNFLDYVEDSTSIVWVGTCNELNASYAADGYGRINGAGALLTTGGVGELSALNGIAGSSAENVAVIHIVGMPSTETQKAKLPNHHTFADGDYTKFIRTQELITCDQQVIEVETAAEQIDTALTKSYLLQKPVVIGIAWDLFDAKIDATTIKLNLALPETGEDLHEIANKLVDKIKIAKNPLIIIDAKSRNYNLVAYAKQLVDKTHIPYVTTIMAKGDISEDNPHFLGEYFGKYSNQYVLDYVHGSDLIIWFGRVDTDLNSAGYSTVHDYSKMLRVDHNLLAFFDNDIRNVNGINFTNVLIDKLSDYECSYEVSRPIRELVLEQNILNQTSFWDHVHKLIKKDSTIILEAGTCIFGFFDKQLPENVQVINQLLWGSIGYSVGATLGVLTTNVKPNVYLFVGDGSFQLTGQEVSTMLRHKYNPVVFLINNNGYTIERYIHGAKRKYNDIAKWNYCDFVKSFDGPLMTWKIESIEQLNCLEHELNIHADKLRFVEVILDKYDVPLLMNKVFKR